MKKTVLILSAVFSLSLSATTNIQSSPQVANKVVVSASSVGDIQEISKARKKLDQAKARKKLDQAKARKKLDQAKARKKLDQAKARKKLDNL